MTKRRWTTLGFLFLYLVTILFVTPASANTKQKPIVLGYYSKDWYTDKDSYNSLAKNHANLDYIATFAARINSNGGLVVDFPPSEGIELAKSKGVKPLLVVHNIHNGMDTATAAAVLGNPQKRWQLAQNITSLVKKEGYAGVNIDLEAIPPKNRDDYSKFLWELKGLLQPGYLLTAAVPAKTSDQLNNSWSGGYDYREIGRACDYVMLMTYDEHWFGGKPGPIASLPWVQKVLDFAVSQMPSQKVILGLATYGYDWSAASTKSVKWNNVDSIIKNTGAQVRWDNKSSSPYFYYWTGTQKHEVWFENKYSLGIKLGFVNSYNLAGVGFWRMGFENDDFWQTINQKL
ncbi:hypothetical protein N752_15075 [Desulforamulus aquiferis]|nr:glycosyl hydrolase family 18 protein [Desulforamulus aquiferis]RYD04693.1 hypothetical protein N752_15075 [Desulforamulus aquiferis]